MLRTRSARQGAARFAAACSLCAGALLIASATAGAANFTNRAPLAIPAGSGTVGNASVYPSPISVSGLSGVVQKATVTLNGFAHQCPIDVDVLLVGPGGQSSILMSDAGDCANEKPVRPGVNLTFSSSGQNLLPCLDFNSTPKQLPGGTYRPTDYSPAANGVLSVCNPSDDRDHGPDQPGPLADVFGGLTRPVGGWGHSLDSFVNTDPNGTWQLYVTDQYPVSTGRMGGGWTLNLATSPTPVPVPLSQPNTPQTPNIAAKVTTSAFRTKQKVLRQRGVKASLHSTVAGTLLASGTVRAGKSYRFRSVRRRVPAGSTTVLLKLPKAGLNAVKSALARHRKVRARITLVLTTATGIKTTAHKTVTLIR